MSLSTLMRHLRELSAPLTGRVKPFDYALTCTDAAASLPVIGRYLEPLGTAVAAGAWIQRNAPSSAAWLNGAAQQISGHTRIAPRVGELQALADAALAGVAAVDRPGVSWPAPDRYPPYLRARALRGRFLYRSSVRYGDASQQVLDVWRRPDLAGPAPVLVFVPGGGWLHGGRQLQGYNLMAHLARQGWVCVSVQYRVAPRHRWPRHIRDVRAAVAWTRAHIQDFGGDPNFVAAAGCSAGGHLAALTGLAPDDAYFNAELPPGADPSVDAVVSLYGRYDWTDRSTRDADEFVGFLERVVVRKSIDHHREVFDNASPINRIHAGAPPFLVIHGDSDHVIPVQEARAFVTALQAVSGSTVHYLEIPAVGHGFDLTDRWATQAAIESAGQFLAEVRRNHATHHRADVV
jgi:acetyl esterase/lipase